MLDLAFHSFAQKGYEGTTLRDLAKQLGVSHNLLNVRFGSKADLWRCAVDAQIAMAAPPVFQAFDFPGMNDEQRLRELVHRFCLWTTNNPELVGMTFAEGRRSTWRLDYIVEAYILPFKERLDALLEIVAAERPVHPISTPALMAMLVQGVGFYFASAPMLDRMGVRKMTPDHIDRQVRIFADFILSALLPDVQDQRFEEGGNTDVEKDAAIVG